VTCRPFSSFFSLFSFVYSFGLLSLSTCTHGFFHLQYPERSGTAFGHKSFKFIIGGPRETNEGCFQIFSARPWGCDSLSISDVLIPINPPLICILEIPPLPQLHPYILLFGVFFSPLWKLSVDILRNFATFFTVYSWSELYLRSWHAHSLFEHPPLFHYHSAFPLVSGEVWVLWVLGFGFLQLFFFFSRRTVYFSLPFLFCSAVSFWVVWGSLFVLGDIDLCGFFVGCFLLL